MHAEGKRESTHAGRGDENAPKRAYPQHVSSDTNESLVSVNPRLDTIATYGCNHYRYIGARVGTRLITAGYDSNKTRRDIMAL